MQNSLAVPESRSVVAGGKQGGTERRADEGDTSGGVPFFTFLIVVIVSQVCTSIRFTKLSALKGEFIICRCILSCMPMILLNKAIEIFKILLLNNCQELFSRAPFVRIRDKPGPKVASQKSLVPKETRVFCVEFSPTG